MIDVRNKSKFFLKPVLFFVVGANVLLFLLFGVLFAAAAEPHAPPEPFISITAVDEPLGQVLDKIGATIQYEFKVDEMWQDHPVTISVDGIPLNEGLKRILANLNHAIIYENDTTIKIAILVQDENNPGGGVPDRSYRGSAEPIPFPDRRPEPSDNSDAEESSGADEPPPDAPAGDPEQ